MKQIVHHDCHKELHDIDLKATPARLYILRVLEQATLPLDVMTICAALKKENVHIDRVTVFRILNALTKKGVLRVVQFNEGKLRYEYAAKPPHHHFVCEHCGGITDIQGCVLHSYEQEIEKQKGILIKHHLLEFFGLCQKCRS